MDFESLFVGDVEPEDLLSELLDEPLAPLSFFSEEPEEDPPSPDDPPDDWALSDLASALLSVR